MFTGSDRKYISFETSSSVTRHVPKRNPRKTDWIAFEEKTKKFFSSKAVPEVSNEVELNNLSDLISGKLLKFYEESCPVPKAKRGKSYPHWWTTEIGNLIKVTRQLRNATKNPYLSESNFQLSWEKYVASKNCLKALIKKEKKRTWRNFCEDITSTTDAARLRKVLSKSSHVPTYIKRADETYTESSKEVLDLLMDTHFPGSITGVEQDGTSYINNGRSK